MNISYDKLLDFIKQWSVGRFVFLLTLIALVFLISCNSGQKEKEITEMTNKYNDTTWYNIPVAKVIYPFDSVYKYESEDEKTEFLLFQFSLEDYLSALADYSNSKYLKCPNLSTEITADNLASENSVVSHAMNKNYMSTILFFIKEGGDLEECRKAMKNLRNEILHESLSDMDRVHLAPLLFNGDKTKFIGYILPENSYYKYAKEFNWENLKNEIRSTYFKIDYSKFQKDINIIDNRDVVLLGLSRSFELNPDVLEVVDLSANISE